MAGMVVASLDYKSHNAPLSAWGSARGIPPGLGQSRRPSSVPLCSVPSAICAPNEHGHPVANTSSSPWNARNPQGSPVCEFSKLTPSAHPPSLAGTSRTGDTFPLKERDKSGCYSPRAVSTWMRGLVLTIRDHSQPLPRVLCPERVLAS